MATFPIPAHHAKPLVYAGCATIAPLGSREAADEKLVPCNAQHIETGADGSRWTICVRTTGHLR